MRQGIRDITLDIVGKQDTDPAYYREICDLVASEGVSDFVHFHGKVTEEVLRDLYAHADVFLFANAPQTWGLAVVEAMLMGCATVVTDGCGAHEVLTDGDNALIAKAQNPESLAEKIAYLVQNPEARERIRDRGEEFVRENISWDRYARDMADIFRGTYSKK